MELSEIIKDSLTYPTKNITALILYLFLGLIIGIIAVITGISLYGSNIGLNTITMIVGIIVIIALFLLMFGFSIDIIKYGIQKRDDAPGIDLVRQISNGLKYILTGIIYLIIPIIITIIISALTKNNTLTLIIGAILMIIFSFALSIATCRLAETDEFRSALNFNGVIEDFNQIGITKVITTIIVSIIVGMAIVFILSLILGLILSVFNSQALTNIIVPIVSVILDAWLLFYSNRMLGLLYSCK